MVISIHTHTDFLLFVEIQDINFDYASSHRGFAEVSALLPQIHQLDTALPPWKALLWSSVCSDLMRAIFCFGWFYQLLFAYIYLFCLDNGNGRKQFLKEMKLVFLLTFEGLPIFSSCEFKTASWERAYPSRLDATWCKNILGLGFVLDIFQTKKYT